ncbi:MAG: UDP-N-acetylmuramoyl-L-alanine--D-glutamate ligase, partial [Firmicutes bacterium]|nr:UDP-N-acetylmuramoyl-L-alanine--D-glutamate ligase [Bacillota bacterium]
MNFKDKRVLIIGAGISGKGAYNALIHLGACPIIFDDSCDVVDCKILDNVDIVVISPSVKLTHLLVQTAKRKGMYICGEIELGFAIHTMGHNSQSPTIAITGTNGKTTLCRMLNQLLQLSGRTVCLAGNIGVSFSSAASLMDYDVSILEVSSFQLQSIDFFAPKISIITNISPDHLDIHDNMQEYVNAKFAITKNQTKDDYLLLGDIDQKYLQGLKTKAKVIHLGVSTQETELMPQLHLSGEFNHRVLYQVAKIFKISDDLVRQTIDSYVSDSHRLEFVARVGNTDYINDSKATNIGATLYALSQVKGSIALLLGGSDKGLDYNELFVKIPTNVHYIFAFGNITNT